MIMKTGKNKLYHSFIWTFMKPYKGSFLALYLCLGAGSVIKALVPMFISVIVDEVVYHQQVKSMLSLSLCYMVCLCCLMVLYLLHPNIWQYLGNRFVFDIRQKVFDHILDAKAAYLTDMKTGDLVNIIDRDVDECLNIIQRNVFHVFNYSISIVVSLVVIAHYNIWLCGMIVICIPTIVFSTNAIGKRAKRQSDEEREKYGNYIGWLSEMLKGLREIKLLAAGNNVLNKFDGYYEEIVDVNVRKRKLEFQTNQINKGIAMVLQCGLYGLIAYLTFHGELMIGEVVAALYYFNLCKTNLDILSFLHVQKQWRSSCVQRVESIIHMDVEADEDGKNELNIISGIVEFDQVEFQYDERAKVLNQISMKIKRGENVCLVGKSGAGKSTIVSLLLKYYKPSKGRILIDGQDIQDCTLKSVRNSIGVIMQDTIIFKGTIRDNLRLGRKNATDEEIIEAINKAALGEWLRTLPNGIDTMLSAGGSELSGGQRQRLSIARIFLKNPKIIIFDEATSALDQASERLVNEGINALKDSRTTIMIAHRLSTVLMADKIAVLKDGTINGYGHHEELFKENEEYQILFKEQYSITEGLIV